VSQETCHHRATSTPGRGASGERSTAVLTAQGRPARALNVEACDPKRLIRDALGGAAPGSGGWSARDLYLAWLLDLPVEIDAAHAAAVLISRTRPPATSDHAAQDLLALLRTTTAYPRERLDSAAADRSQLH
jgi:hypothetical protein